MLAFYVAFSHFAGFWEWYCLAIAALDVLEFDVAPSHQMKSGCKYHNWAWSGPASM